jgi:hypothetical protein
LSAGWLTGLYYFQTVKNLLLKGMEIIKTIAMRQHGKAFSVLSTPHEDHKRSE